MIFDGTVYMISNTFYLSIPHCLDEGIENNTLDIKNLIPSQIMIEILFITCLLTLFLTKITF